jgi:hypothetical protein
MNSDGGKARRQGLSLFKNCGHAIPVSGREQDDRHVQGRICRGFHLVEFEQNHPLIISFNKTRNKIMIYKTIIN